MADARARLLQHQVSETTDEKRFLAFERLGSSGS